MCNIGNCPANLGSGPCRNDRDCLPDEKCRPLRVFDHLSLWPTFRSRKPIKCCIARPSTASPTTAGTSSTDETGTTEPTLDTTEPTLDTTEPTLDTTESTLETTTNTDVFNDTTSATPLETTT